MTFEWPIERSLLPALPDLTDPPSAEYTKALLEHNAAADLAVSIMWALSGRQFGLRDVTVRPCRGPLPNHHGSGPVTSYVLSWEGDRWINWWCGCVGGCRETGPNVVHLPGPVAEVTEVKINGVVLSPLVWVVEGNKLYRRDTAWPRQDLNRPAGDVNTWTVTYKVGLPVPPGVDELTGLLAAEFIKAINNSGNCRLPRNVTTASRQGVTYRVYDPTTFYDKGKTGLSEVDMWLSAVNPNHLMANASVR